MTEENGHTEEIRRSTNENKSDIDQKVEKEVEPEVTPTTQNVVDHAYPKQ